MPVADPTPSALDAHRHEWETLAEVDPLWAILTTADRKHNRWDVDAFFETGVEEVAPVLARLDTLGLPARRGTLLDFGCGVGRLTRAFAAHFDECIGVDIADTMVAKARTLNAGIANCRFECNPASDLAGFADDTFDMIYSSLVLQHVPTRAGIERYLVELVRVLRPDGILVFQLPCFIARRHRLRPRRHLYLLLRRLGFTDRFLHHRMNLTTMRETFVETTRVRAVLEGCGATVIDVDHVRAAPGLESATYWVTVGARE